MEVTAIPSANGPAKIDRAEAVKVARQFEAIFVQQIVAKMREGSDLLGQDSMFGSGPGSKTYSDWFDTHMSEHLASTGRIGVADAILRQLDQLAQIAEPETKEQIDAIA